MKLNGIPQNTVVHTPTEAEARELLAILHENGYKWPNFSKYSLLDMDWWNTDDMCYIIKPHAKIVGWNTRFSITAHSLEKPMFITLAEFKEKYVEEEKPQPKFKVGDKVKVIEPNCWHSGQIGIVRKARTSSEQVMVAFGEGGAANFYLEECLEPYTEPETKPTEDMETKEKQKGEKGNNSEISQSNNLSQDVANCDKPETKELNLCELLKGHTCEKFYSSLYDNMVDIHLYGDVIGINYGVYNTSICSNGAYFKYGVCTLFPTRALYEQYPLDPYTAWMKWQEEQKKYTLAIAYNCPDKDNAESIKHLSFRSPSDRDKCIEQIKAIIGIYSK